MEVNDIPDYTPSVFILKFFAAGGRVNYRETKRRTGLGNRDIIQFASHKGISFDALVMRAKEYSFQDHADEQELFDFIIECIRRGRGHVKSELEKYAERTETFTEKVKRLNLL